MTPKMNQNMRILTAVSSLFRFVKEASSKHIIQTAFNLTTLSASGTRSSMSPKPCIDKSEIATQDKKEMVSWSIENSLKRNRQDDCRYVHDEVLYLFLT